jgi:hypothetical protein
MLLTRKRLTAARTHATRPAASAPPALPSARVGRIAAVVDGQVLVACDGVLDAPAPAVLAAAPPAPIETTVGRPVVLVFEQGEARRPIVIGWVESVAADTGRTLRVGGRRIRVQAEQEIELRCGEASITLTADGRVLIEGRGVLTHARELNRIRGGQVKIN